MFNFSFFINKKFYLLIITFLIFFVSGYDLIFLNDENLLLNIFFFIIIFLFLKLKNSLIEFNKINKINLIIENYNMFSLLKVFYLNYVTYLEYNYNIYNNYYNYYNIYNNYYKYILKFYNKTLFNSYIYFFIKNFKQLNNLIALSYLDYYYGFWLTIGGICKFLVSFKSPIVKNKKKIKKKK